MKSGGMGVCESARICWFQRNWRGKGGGRGRGERSGTQAARTDLEKKARMSEIVKCGGMPLILTHSRSFGASMR